MNHRHVSLPPQLRATIDLPRSKSISARALILNALCGSPLRLEGLSDCDDTQAVIAALRDNPEVVDVGAAGTAMRFLTAYYATRQGETHTLTGTTRMKQRPIGILVDALRTLGAEIDYLENEGYPPLRIRGKQLHGAALTMPGNVSSQFLSAILMIAITMSEEIELNIVGKVVSLPYLEMTQALLAVFGGAVSDRAAAKSLPPYAIEADWSAASYWYALVALSGDADARVLLRGLCEQSVQGDSRCAELFRPLGVQTSFTADGVVLTKCARTELRCWEVDFTHQPDLAQTFVVVCALLRQSFRFSGLESLKIKETNRIVALQMELDKLGVALLEPAEGCLSYDADRQLRCKDVDAEIFIDTYDDHRMAMAFAPAAYHFSRLHIRYPEVVSKSYPNFWADIDRL